MSPTIYVLDTSYLLELFACGRDSQPVASREVRKRFKTALGKGGRFFVPLPCLFELGDHIADVRHDAERERLAKLLCTTVADCLSKSNPWTITPTAEPSAVLPPLLERFVPLAAKQSLGLVDAFTADEAARLKKKFADLKSRVHLWTNDRPLKRLEPDKEEDPYLWNADGTRR